MQCELLIVSDSPSLFVRWPAWTFRGPKRDRAVWRWIDHPWSTSCVVWYSAELYLLASHAGREDDNGTHSFLCTSWQKLQWNKERCRIQCNVRVFSARVASLYGQFLMVLCIALVGDGLRCSSLVDWLKIFLRMFIFSLWSAWRSKKCCCVWRTSSKLMSLSSTTWTLTSPLMWRYSRCSTLLIVLHAASHKQLVTIDTESVWWYSSERNGWACTGWKRVAQLRWPFTLGYCSQRWAAKCLQK